MPDISVTESSNGQDLPGHEGRQCLNCGAVLIGPYCAQCGQYLRELKKPFWALTSEFADNLFSFDSRVFRTLRPMLLAPGRLSRDYVEGKRARFVQPVRLLLVSVLLFFLTVELGNVALMQISRQPVESGVQGLAEFEDAGEPTQLSFEFFTPIRSGSEASLIPEDELAEIEREFNEQAERDSSAGAILDFATRLLRGLNAASQNPALINGLFNTWLPRAMLLLVPVFALLLRMTQWRRDAWFFDQLVFSLHFHAFLFLLLTLLALLGLAGAGSAGGAIWFFSVVVYLLTAMKRFYGQGWVRTVLKFLMVSALYNLVLLFVLGAILVTGLSDFQ